MGKKNKKQDKYEQESQEEKPSLKLVLKVGGVPLVPDAESLDDGMERRAKKKRKLQEKSDSENESGWSQQNFDDDDDEDFGKSRNPREKKLTNEERTALQCCLDHIHKALQRKDVNGFFAFPVTDSIAPGYSNVITKAMDFSTMKKQIDKGLYKSVAEYKSDFQLMMKNCMAYNHPETIYHKEAKRLLAVGNKHINKERINQMKRNFSFMLNLSKEEIGLEDEVDNNNDINEFPIVNMSQTNKDNNIGRYEAIPDDLTPEEILQQVQTAASVASERLQILTPMSKMGYLKKKPDGTTTLTILNPDNSGIISPKERVVDLGGLVGRLNSGSDSISIPKEDKRNKVTPVTYLNYGAFTSFAPIFDSSSANLDKDQSDLLLSTYGDETGIQYAKSLQSFVSNCGEYVTSMVDDLLNVLTNGMHSKSADSMNNQDSSNNGRKDYESNMEADRRRGENVFKTEVNIAADDMLKKASNLILDLHETQHSRLSQVHATRVDNCKPSNDEINLANQVTSELTQLIKNVTPGDVVGVKELRHAMGVSLDLFEADANVEDLIGRTNNNNEYTIISNVSQDNGNSIFQENIQHNQTPVQKYVGTSMFRGATKGCNMNSSSVMPTNNPGFQVLQANIQDGTIMLGGGGQMILAGHQFNPNNPQVMVGNNFQSPASYTVINTNNNGQFLGTGGFQILQTGGQSSMQGGNIFLQADGSQQLITNSFHGNSELNKMQPGSIVIQQPVYNTNISIGQASTT